MGKRINKGFYRASWKDHLTFTIRERRAFLVLFFLLCCEAGVLYHLRHRQVPMDQEQWTRMIQTADSILAIRTFTGYSRERQSEEFKADSLFYFDPNKCDLKQWIMLGLTEKQAGSVLKYVSRGGVFHVKSDLRKMRTVPGPIYESWKPYVLLPDTLFKAGRKQSRELTDPVDLNTADSTALDRLRGIGPFMASRIVRYRDALGGFVHSNQMKEVYGMTDSLCIALLDQSNIKSELPIRTLGLNSTPWDSLKRHPYIGFKLAGMIDRYRKQHPFQDINELMSVPLVTPEIFRKLAPYLTVR